MTIEQYMEYMEKKAELVGDQLREMHDITTSFVKENICDIDLIKSRDDLTKEKSQLMDFVGEIYGSSIRGLRYSQFKRVKDFMNPLNII